MATGVPTELHPDSVSNRGDYSLFMKLLPPLLKFVSYLRLSFLQQAASIALLGLPAIDQC